MHYFLITLLSAHVLLTAPARAEARRIQIRLYSLTTSLHELESASYEVAIYVGCIPMYEVLHFKVITPNIGTRKLFEYFFRSIRDCVPIPSRFIWFFFKFSFLKTFFGELGWRTMVLYQGLYQTSIYAFSGLSTIWLPLEISTQVSSLTLFVTLFRSLYKSQIQAKNSGIWWTNFFSP